ncbi:MAG: GAK system CofD-like protein [Gemmatimonadota bacterium]
MTADAIPPVSVHVRRLAQIPDQVRLERYRHAPELGPRLLFFSGGSALRTFSRRLVDYTHNSIHLITPFDSGGSSAALRRAFRMPAVGDLRNRLMALADQTVRGNPEIYTLFAFRFPDDEEPTALRARLDRMIRGSDALVRAVPEPLRGIVRNHLGFFRDAMPDSFDLRGAAIGNLVLAGGYLNQGRNLDSVLYLFSQLVEARGIVRPVVDANLHLVAELENGNRLVGQHRITGRSTPALQAPVERLFLSRSASDPSPVRPRTDALVDDLIERAELICYPVGSFYTSLLATLLPEGVADAIARSEAPKVFVPNPDGTDPEELGLDLPGKVRRLLACLEASATTRVPPSSVLGYVLVDWTAAAPPPSLVEDAAKHGVEIVRLPLSTGGSAPFYDDDLLAEALLSLA